MAKYSNTVEYNIKTNLDSSGIAKLQSELSKLESQFQVMRNQGLVGKAQTREAIANIELIRNSLNKAFNGKLGMLDTKAFMSNLTAGGKSISSIAQSFSAMGAQGTAAFTRMYGQISRIDTGLRQVSSTSDKIMNTLGNTVRWGLIASAFASVMNAAHQSVEYVKDLDRSLTNIMMVSGETRDNMNEFARQANQVAQRLGGTTVQMTEATKVFIQQGYSLDKSSQLGEYAVHLANVSEQDSATASDEITAYMNAFKIPLDDLGNAISKWAAVANNTAVDVEELSIASQKAASVAATVGVDLDQFAGHIAAIESVTREAPENIGNGLKTIYSRIADISLGETLEDGVNLGSFAKALEKVGVNVLDQTGKLRDAGIILEDLMGVWQELDNTQRAAVAKTVAGRFQLARFEALMNRADIYENAANISRNETGTATYDRMQEEYRNSLEGRSNALQAAIEEIFLNAFETDDFYGLVDATTLLVKAFGDLIEAVGGGKEAFVALGAFLTKSFSAQIGRGISNFIANRQTSQLAERNKATVAAQAQMASYGLSTGNANADKYIQASAAVNQYARIMNPEQIRMVNEELIKYEEQIIAVDKLQQEQKELAVGLGAAFTQLGLGTEVAEKGALELVAALEKTEGDLEKAKGLLENSGFLQLADQAENAQLHILDFANSLENVSAKGEADWQKIQAGAEKYKIELEAVQKEMNKAGQDTTRLTAAIEALEKVQNGDIESIEKLRNALYSGNADLNIFREGIIKVFENCENLNTVLRENAGQLASVSAGAEVTGQKIAGMAQSFNIQHVATQVTNLASAFMSLSFVMMSVRSLGDILKNEDMDPFEKLEQVLMNVSMIAVMGIPMIGQFRTGIATLKEATLAYLAAQTLSNAETATSTALTAAEIALVGVENSEKAILAKTMLTEAAVKEKVSIATIQEIAAQSGLTAAQVAGIASANGLSISIRSLWAAFLTSPLAPIAAAMLAITAAIAGIVYVVQQAEANYRRFDAAVEKANQNLKAAQEGLSTTQEKLSAINQELNKLKNKEDPFEDLTKGTAEWNQALISANQNIIDLIDKYPELAKYLTRGEHGELALSRQGLEEAANQAAGEVARNAAYAASARQQLATAQNTQTTANWGRTSKVEGLAQFRSSFYDLDKAVASNGDYIDNPNAYFSEEEFIAAVDELGHYLQENTNATTEDIAANTSLTEQQAAMIADAEGNLTELGASIINNTAAIDANTLSAIAANEAQAAQILGTTKAYQNADNTTKAILDKQVANYLTSGVSSQYRSKAEESVANLSDAEKQSRYASMQGYVLGGDGKYYKDEASRDSKDESGQIKWDNIDIDNALISAAIADSIREDSDGLVKNIRDLSDDQKQAILDYQNQAKVMINGQEQSFTDYINSQYNISSIDEFVAAIQNGTIALKDFADVGGLEKSNSLSDLEYDVENSGNNLAYQDPNNILNYEKQLESMTAAEAEKWDIEVEDIVDQAELLQDTLESVDEDFKFTEGRARALAVQNQRMAKGLDTLTKNWEDWSDALQDVNKGSVDYINAAQDLTKCIADLVGAEEDLDLSKEFFDSAENMEYLAQAAEGDIDAVNRLGIAVAQDLVSQMEPLEDFSGLDFSDADSEQAWYNMVNSFNQAKDTVIGGLENLQANLDSIGFGQNVYDQLGGADWVNALNEMAAATGMSVEQMNSMLNSMGVQADVTTITKPTTVKVPWYRTEETVTESGEGATKTISKESHVVAQGFDEVPGEVEVAQINTGDAVGTPPSINYVGNGGSPRPSGSGGGGKGGGGGGGGGGSKAKSVKKSADIDKSKPAEVENDIYEKVNATLEKLKDSYSKLNKVKDRTWGKGYRDDAQKGLDLLVKEQKTLDRRIEIAKKYADALKTGKSNLAYGIDMTDKESLASLGLKDSDLDGVIDNYISKFEEVRQAARKLDAEAEEYRNKANAEALAYWQSKGGRLDADGNTITEATMSEDENEYYTDLIEKQKNHYDKLVEKANEQWELAEKINDVTKDYEDTMNQIRDDEEEQLDLAHEIEDIQIDLYQRSLDMLDTMHDINDIAAQMKGFFTKLATDDPFRALTESAQAFENSFKDATYNATAYYNDIIEKLQKEQAQVKANGGEWEKYNEAIEFYNQQKANAVINADGLGSGELAQQSRRLTELERWIQNPNAVDNPYGTNTQALYDAYQEQYQKVTDAALEAEERMESVHESIIEAYDKMAEQQDELVQQYDRVDEQLNRTADRVSLYRGEDAYADQAAISKQRAKVALEAGKSSLKALDKYRQQLAKAQEQQELERPQKIAAAEAEVARLQMALNEDKNNLDLQQQLATAKTVLEQAKYDDSEEIKWLKNQIDETTDYINDKADEAAEHFKDAYENSIDEIAAQTTDKIFGNRDLDLITNDWDWDRDYFGSYKDNVERTLETEKLRLKYLDLLDSAQGSSLGIQRQIKDAMDEQLALLENQKTMSEYDVKLANARLEILQKQIALENAQQNKNQMKLRRDSQGNYKYVYAADQDDIRGKQRELLESEFDAYEMSKDANGDAYQQGIALYQQYIEQRTAIEKKYANDVDMMEKELAKLRENYLRAAEANAEDLQNTYDGMIISVQWMAEHGTEAVQQMTEDVLDALEEKTQESLEAVGIPWNEALANGISDLENLQQTVDETAQAGIDAANDFVEAINGEGDSVVNLVNNANESMQESFDSTTESIDRAKEATDQLGVATDALNQKLGAELGAIDQAKAKIAAYENELVKAQESTSALASQLDLTEKQLANKAKEAEQWKTTYENYKQSIQEEREAAQRKIEEEKKKAEAAKRGGAAGNASTSDIAWGIAQNIWTYGSWGNDPDRHSRISERYGEEVANLTQKYINQYWSTGQLVNYDSDKWGYASGGYTGTWGKDSGLDGKNGKLAFLHQKELVLNQQDTENILEAVQVMRSIMDITKMASLGSSGFDARRISQTATDTIEQRVEITAEFPAANSADDIRQALLGLSDAAMQYAYRER